MGVVVVGKVVGHPEEAPQRELGVLAAAGSLGFGAAVSIRFTVGSRRPG